MLEIKFFEDITQINMSREVGGKPVYWVAAYLVDGLLIDTGCRHTVDEFMDYLKKAPPKLAVNTHYHEDHVAANKPIQELFGIDIYAHPLSIPLIGRPATLFPYQEFTWGYPELSNVLPIPPVIRTNRFRFEVVEVPGHSRDHIGLVERSRGWCFTGDAVVGRSMKTIRPEDDMGVTLVSHRKLAELQMERLVLLTSLGKIFEEGRTILADFAQFVEDLSRKSQDLHASGRSEDEIVTALFGGEDPLAAYTDGQFSIANLIRAVLRMREQRSAIGKE